MPKARVLVTGKIPRSALQRLDEVCDVDAYDGAAAIPREDLLKRVHGQQGLITLITETVDRELLAAAVELRVVANVGVGYNNIDVAAARARGIVVTNTPDVLTAATADFTWALILAITRRLPEGDRLVRRREWRRWALDFMLGTELRNKQLGIVGLGRIGRAVADRGRAFGMRVAYTARAPKADAADAEFMPLDKLLATSDVVSLHVALTPDTHHLIDQAALARMKRSAFLINTTRGQVVDEAALAWALREHLISGAALDVYEREPEVHEALLTLENVVLAPHLGSATVETRTAMADLAVRNVIAVLSGQPALTPVP
jgi:glyoxylate reductase